MNNLVSLLHGSRQVEGIRDVFMVQSQFVEAGVTFG